MKSVKYVYSSLVITAVVSRRMLRWLVVLLCRVHAGTRGGLVEIGDHVCGVDGGTVLHLVLFVCCCVVHFVLLLLCFVIFAVRGYVHIISFLLHLGPSFVTD